MQELPDPQHRAKDKPTDWIPVSIAVTIFIVAAITVLFFQEPPKPPTEPLKRGNPGKDTPVKTDTPAEYKFQ